MMEARVGLQEAARHIRNRCWVVGGARALRS